MSPINGNDTISLATVLLALILVCQVLLVLKAY